MWRLMTGFVEFNFGGSTSPSGFFLFYSNLATLEAESKLENAEGNHNQWKLLPS